MKKKDDKSNSTTSKVRGSKVQQKASFPQVRINSKSLQENNQSQQAQSHNIKGSNFIRKKGIIFRSKQKYTKAKKSKTGRQQHQTLSIFYPTATYIYTES